MLRSLAGRSVALRKSSRAPRLGRTDASQRRGMAEMPVPQSRNAVLFDGHPKSEGWESTLTWFYPLSFVGICAAYGLAPETEIKSWAQREAQARLDIKAKHPDTVFEFGRHYADELQDEAASFWDKFSTKSIRMTEDDDDDDEDEDDE